MSEETGRPPDLPPAGGLRAAVLVTALLFVAAAVSALVRGPRGESSGLMPAFAAAVCLGLALGYFAASTSLRGAWPATATAEGLATATGTLTLLTAFTAARLDEGGSPAAFVVLAAFVALQAWIVWRARRLRLASRTPSAGGIGFGFAAVAGLMVFSAIAIPSNVTPPRYDAAQVSALRSMVSAQSAYQSTNEGLYGRFECLPRPAACLRGYAGPTFLDWPSLDPERYAYRRTFHLGAEARTPSGNPGVKSWAYVAVPKKVGGPTWRSFCADASGVVFFRADGGEIAVKDGNCPPGLAALQ